MNDVGLQLHPDKTRIVYCKDERRRGEYVHTSFTFLGFDFRPRRVRLRSGKMTIGFNPAASRDALKKMGTQVRSWPQDSDVVILINRPDAYDRDSPRAGEADLILAKHRNGPTKTCTVASTLHMASFRDLARGF